MPDIPPDHVVVPSVATTDGAGFYFTLSAQSPSGGTARWVTPGFGPIEVQTCHAAAVSETRAVKVPVDYFVTREAIRSPSLTVSVGSDEIPLDYIITVSIRPAQLDADAPQSIADTAVLDVAPRSQHAARADVGNRICSPTSLSMAMNHLGTDHDFDELVARCHHRTTDLFGVWPQNIWAAGGFGLLGAVEALADWDALHQALERRTPVVASIAPQYLSNAPNTSSGGHLVLIRGIRNNHVIVHDPAADTDHDVPRRYAVGEFHRAWLSARGAVYLFSASK
ncbi:MAG: C39 family peptidase [Gammaproteobacteria bacterium]|nr:C39 family peptidase [Gammaproteobacteria bacterium]